ncbi:fluoride efflux transporter CrcB [Bermanella sp. R86510]|uniref:fluoride efflux transporter CrcB n=1 Tax=unclassified Bermanella TaxID=2627862 RepID=UPI0037C5A688
MHYLFIAIGGAFGAMGRAYVSALTMKQLGTSFPFATLAVNLIGALLMGFFAVLIIDYLKMSGYWRELVMVGFLGAFTTFSTFSMEGLNLINSGQWQTAIVYFLVSVTGCLIACFVGWQIAKLIF